MFPLDVASGDGRILCTPEPDAPLYARLPMPLFFDASPRPGWRHCGPRIGGLIKVVRWIPADGGAPGEIRIAGLFALQTTAGRALSTLATRFGQPVPVGAQLSCLHGPEIIGEPPDLTFRFRHWTLRAALADPPGGAAWENACIWPT